MSLSQDKRTTGWRWKWRVSLWIFLLIPICVVGWIGYGVYTQDDTYDQAMDYSGNLKVLEGDFRRYFHGKSDYSALTLAQLHAQGIVSENSWALLKQHRYDFHPFSSQTRDGATVLVIHGYWWKADELTKGDLTASNEAMDHVQ